MNRSRLRKQFLKNRSVESRMKYNKQRNIYLGKLKSNIILDQVMLTIIKSFGKLSSHCLEIKSSAKVI